MDLGLALDASGGLASRARLVDRLGRRGLERAIRDGKVVRVGRGRYALPYVAEAEAAAHGLNGHLSHTSAALHHGWEVLRTPERPHVIVPTKRRISPERRRSVVLHRGDLSADDVNGNATNLETTLLHCMRALPLPEALAVADSALRHGVPPATLHRAALTPGPGSRQARRVAQQARPEADNPFESGLRAISLGVPRLNLVPQVWLKTRGGPVRPDLVDEDLGLVVEADSFAWHGDRVALKRDARRYNDLVVAGWIVLRICWEDVMFEQDRVREVLGLAVTRAEAQGSRDGHSPLPA